MAWNDLPRDNKGHTLKKGMQDGMECPHNNYEEDLGEPIYNNKHGFVYYDGDKYRITDKNGNEMGEGFPTSETAIHYLNNDYEDSDYEDDLEEKNLPDIKIKKEEIDNKHGPKEYQIHLYIDGEEVSSIDGVMVPFENRKAVVNYINRKYNIDLKEEDLKEE